MTGRSPDWPPWEWAAGDPITCGRVSALFGALYGGTAVLIVLTVLELSGLISVNWPPVPQPVPLLETLVAFLFLPALLVVLPRRTAMIASLGISPVGIRIRLAFPFDSTRPSVVPWSQVRQIRPDSLELSPAFLVPQRYRLTPHQSIRLKSFVGAGRPSA